MTPQERVRQLMLPVEFSHHYAANPYLFCARKNGSPRSLVDVPSPSRYIMVLEGCNCPDLGLWCHRQFCGQENKCEYCKLKDNTRLDHKRGLNNFHDGGQIWLFADGHVKFMSGRDTTTPFNMWTWWGMRAKPGEPKNSCGHLSYWDQCPWQYYFYTYCDEGIGISRKPEPKVY